MNSSKRLLGVAGAVAGSALALGVITFSVLLILDATRAGSAGGNLGDRIVRILDGERPEECLASGYGIASSTEDEECAVPDDSVMMMTDDQFKDGDIDPMEKWEMTTEEWEAELTRLGEEYYSWGGPSLRLRVGGDDAEGTECNLVSSQYDTGRSTLKCDNGMTFYVEERWGDRLPNERNEGFLEIKPDDADGRWLAPFAGGKFEDWDHLDGWDKQGWEWDGNSFRPERSDGPFSYRFRDSGVFGKGTERWSREGFADGERFRYERYDGEYEFEGEMPDFLEGFFTEDGEPFSFERFGDGGYENGDNELPDDFDRSMDGDDIMRLLEGLFSEDGDFSFEQFGDEDGEPFSFERFGDGGYESGESDFEFEGELADLLQSLFSEDGEFSFEGFEDEEYGDSRSEGEGHDRFGDGDESTEGFRFESDGDDELPDIFGELMGGENGDIQGLLEGLFSEDGELTADQLALFMQLIQSFMQMMGGTEFGDFGSGGSNGFDFGGFGMEDSDPEGHHDGDDSDGSGHTNPDNDGSTRSSALPASY